MPELTVAWVERLIEAIAEVVRRHGAKRADGRQRARLGAAERVVVAVIVDVLSFEATRQADVLHEHIARVHAFSVAWVRTAAATAAEIARTAVAIPWIVAPSGIVTSHGAPPEDAQAPANQGGRKSRR
jgi:hypothetical protein